MGDAEAADDGSPIEEAVAGGEQTVFVNASNWAAGPNAARNNEPVGAGERGVQPVIVDLLE